MMVAWFIGLVAKYAFQRARPVVEDPVSRAPGYSFPSGHALNSAAWATTVVILLWPLLKPLWARVTAVVLAVLVVLVTALDRVLLGVHYPSDVTVGVLTGVGLVLASYAGYVGWNPPDPTEADDPDVGPTPTHQET
jgi:membrane-associated phospholipid phosphatase